MFQDVFEMFKATFEVYLEDKLINRQVLQAPKEMLMVQFMQLYEQIAKEKRPMKVSMIVPQIIWDDFENKQKVIDAKVEFLNNALIAYQENNMKDL